MQAYIIGWLRHAKFGLDRSLRIGTRAPKFKICWISRVYGGFHHTYAEVRVHRSRWNSFLLFIPLLYCLLPSLLLLLSFPGREENRRKKRVGYRKVIGRYGHGHAAGFAVAWLCLQFLAWHLVTRVTLFKIDSSRSITVGLACLQQSLSVEHTFA